MIRLKGMKKSAYVPLILLGGIFFLWLLIFEYQQNQQLLSTNQQLLSDSTKRTLSYVLEQQLSGYPESKQQLEREWHEYSPDFYWRFNHQQVFPPLPGKVNSFWTQYWQSLRSLIFNRPQENKITENFSEQLLQRAAILRTLRTALGNGDSDTLRRFLSSFLAHKENYKLSVREELASSLLLLEIDENYRWNREFIHSVLFAGFQSDQSEVKPVFHLLFDNLKLFSQDDSTLIVNKIQEYAERVNLPLDKLKRYQFFLSKGELQIPVTHCSDGLVLGETFLSKAIDSNNCLVTEVTLSSIIETLKSTLVSTGQLHADDRIVLDNASLPARLKDLPITVTRPSWQSQSEQQQIYMAVKILLLLILVALSIYAVLAIQQRQQRKEKYIQLKEDFVNLVSHELKTPLASIRLMAETLQKRLTKSLDGRDYPQRIEREADRLWLMVDNILSFNRLQAENFSLKRTKVVVRDLIEDIIDAFPQPIVATNRLPDTFEMDVDEPLFTLVILNLLSNAVKYNQHDRVEVVFEMIIESDITKVIVTDNGCGIDEPSWHSVFESFYQKNNDGKKGFGLGLALSRKVMQMHGGQIEIRQSKTISKGVSQFEKNRSDDFCFDSGTQWQLVIG